MTLTWRHRGPHPARWRRRAVRTPGGRHRLGAGALERCTAVTLELTEVQSRAAPGRAESVRGTGHVSQSVSLSPDDHQIARIIRVHPSHSLTTHSRCSSLGPGHRSSFLCTRRRSRSRGRSRGPLTPRSTSVPTDCLPLNLPSRPSAHPCSSILHSLILTHHPSTLLRDYTRHPIKVRSLTRGHSGPEEHLTLLAPQSAARPHDPLPSHRRASASA